MSPLIGRRKDTETRRIPLKQDFAEGIGVIASVRARLSTGLEWQGSRWVNRPCGR